MAAATAGSENVMGSVSVSSMWWAARIWEAGTEAVIGTGAGHGLGQSALAGSALPSGGKMALRGLRALGSRPLLVTGLAGLARVQAEVAMLLAGPVVALAEVMTMMSEGSSGGVKESWGEGCYRAGGVGGGGRRRHRTGGEIGDCGGV